MGQCVSSRLTGAKGYSTRVPFGWQPRVAGAPVICNVFIGDLDVGQECVLNKIGAADRMGGAVDSIEGGEALGRDPDLSLGKGSAPLDSRHGMEVLEQWALRFRDGMWVVLCRVGGWT